MKMFDRQSLLRFQMVCNRRFCVPLIFGLILAGTQIGEAQNWPGKQPDANAPLPQYVPRYPLQLQHPAPATPSKPTIEAQTTDAKAERSQTKRAHTKPAQPTPPIALQPARQIPNLPAARPLNPKPTLSNYEMTPSACMNSMTTRNSHAVIDHSIYRDRSRFPVDPRKPCNECVRPSQTLPRCYCDLPGLKGRPYMDKELGGCQCGKKKQPKHPQFSVYWPRPFSARLDDHFPNKAAERHEPCQKKRLVDVFDSLESFKLINYHRKDNGYCGRGADPYGCLGESRYRSRVAGINDDALRVPTDRDFVK